MEITMPNIIVVGFLPARDHIARDEVSLLHTIYPTLRTDQRLFADHKCNLQDCNLCGIERA